MFDWKILQSDWLRIFWSISQEPEFSQIRDLCRNIANNIHFHYRTNSVKINNKIFQYIKKTLFFAHFWPIFPIFGAKNFFLENPALSCTTSYGFLASCQNVEKTNDKFLPRQTKGNAWTDQRTDGRRDRPYFIGPFQLTPGVRKTIAYHKEISSVHLAISKLSIPISHISKLSNWLY